MLRPRLAAGALLALAASLIAPPADAQARRDTGFDLVRLEPSARASALAGAGGALSGDDPLTALYNPALLTPEADRRLSLGYVNHLADVSAGTATYARDLSRLGVSAAATVRFLSYGDFDRTDTEGNADGTFDASEAALTLTAAKELAPRVRGGVNVHALFASIDDAGAQALSADAGVTYRVESQGLVLGASVHHVGTVLGSLGETADRLPLDVRLTASKRLRYVPFTITAQGFDLQDLGDRSEAADSSAIRNALDHLAVGGELQLGRALALRGGYNARRAEALRSGDRLDLAGISMGFGLDLRRVALDYAYNGWSQYGGLHQFGIRTRL